MWTKKSAKLGSSHFDWDALYRTLWIAIWRGFAAPKPKSATNGQPDCGKKQSKRKREVNVSKLNFVLPRGNL
jgi:hypothetical protein